MVMIPKEKSKWPFDGCEDAADLGWMHGTEDIHGQFRYRPGISLSDDEFEEYKESYKEARRGWD